MSSYTDMKPEAFTFLGYDFDSENFVASFRYQGIDKTVFEERIIFTKTTQQYSKELLNRALFLSFILIGTSYYKARPTPKIILDAPLDNFQAEFFNKVYQEGLSQYAFENNLTRADLAHFEASENYTAPEPVFYQGEGVLALQSGGKDSLLTATLLNKSGKNWMAWYIGSTENHPTVINNLGVPVQTARRIIDMPHLQQSGGKNGHVPITYIVQSLALAQAILNGQKYVLTSIGREGAEPHAHIDDLPVNHQWSKTWEAEQLFAKYIHQYITEGIEIGSPLRGFSELKIAELFVKSCWKKYGHKFSSCNVANYKQGNNNSELKWCGHCAKCANSYLLFAPFLEPDELQNLFEGNPKDLFLREDLWLEFKGLLSIDDVMKPFECVGEVAELRKAYALKKSGYADLPFAAPGSEFDYNQKSAVQTFVGKLI